MLTRINANLILYSPNLTILFDFHYSYFWEGKNMINISQYTQEPIDQYMLQQYLQDDQLIIKLRFLQQIQNELPIPNSNELSKEILENKQEDNKFRVKRLYEVRLKYDNLSLDLKQIFLNLDQIRQFLEQESQPNQRALISEKSSIGVAEVSLKVEMRVLNRVIYRYFPLLLNQYQIPQYEKFVTKKPKAKKQDFQGIKHQQQKPMSSEFVKNVGTVHQIVQKQQQQSQNQLQQQQYISDYFGADLNQQQQNPAAKKSTFITINRATPIFNQYRTGHAIPIFSLKQNEQEQHSRQYNQLLSSSLRKQPIMQQKQDKANQNFMNSNLNIGLRPNLLLNYNQMKGFRPYRGQQDIVKMEDISSFVSELNKNTTNNLIKAQEQEQANIQPANNQGNIANINQSLVKIQQERIRINYIFSETFKNPQILVSNKSIAGCYNNNKSCKTVLIEPFSFHNIPFLSNLESFQINIRINKLKRYVGIGMCEKKTIIQHEYKQAASKESRLSNQHGYYIVDWCGNTFINCQTHPNIKSFKFKTRDVINIQYKIAEKVVKFTKITSRSFQSTQLKLDANAKIEELCFCALLSCQGDQVMIMSEI